MTYNGTNTQDAVIDLEIKNRLGGIAAVEPGSVEVLPEDDKIVVIRNADNELNFTAQLLVPGLSGVIVKADADLGDGVETIEARLGFDIAPAGAVSIGAVVQLVERDLGI